MALKENSAGLLSRRSLMAGAGASVFLHGGPAMGSETGAPDLHVRVAQRARALAHGADVVLRLLLPKGSEANVRPIVQAFTQMADIKVEIIVTHVDQINTELYLDRLSHSQQYDLALPATFGLPDLVSSQAILPITNFANQYEPDGFRDGVLYSIGDRFDGETYGFQTDGDVYMTFFNKAMHDDPVAQSRYADMFGDALGIPETWSDFDRQMRFFHAPENGKWGGLLFRTPSYLAWEWWVRFHAKGVWPFSVNMEPQISSDEGVAAVEDMIRATEYLHPNVSKLGLFENWERFERGDIYCNIGWGGTQKHLHQPESPMRDNLIFGQIPGGKFGEKAVPMPYFNWGWNYVISKNTHFPEIAYLFSLFASSPAMSTLAVRQPDGFFDPYRPEHYADPDIQRTYSPEFLAVHRKSMETAIPDLYLSGQSEYFRILADWLARALAREVSPKQALDRVAQRWRLVTNASGLRLQKIRWKRLRQKYPPQVRAVLKDLR